MAILALLARVQIGRCWASPPDWAAQAGNAEGRCWPSFSGYTLHFNPTLKAVFHYMQVEVGESREGKRQRSRGMVLYLPEPLFPNGISMLRRSTLGVTG